MAEWKETGKEETRYHYWQMYIYMYIYTSMYIYIYIQSELLELTGEFSKLSEFKKYICKNQLYLCTPVTNDPNLRMISLTVH